MQRASLKGDKTTRHGAEEKTYLTIYHSLRGRLLQKSLHLQEAQEKSGSIYRPITPNLLTAFSIENFLDHLLLADSKNCIIRFMEAGESSPAQQIFIFSPSLQARVSRGKSMVP